MDAPTPAAPAAPLETSIWRTKRWPYALIFVVSYLALAGLIYLVYKEPNAVPALSFFGAPFAAFAWRALWVCLFSSTYRLTPDRLDIVGPGGSKSLALRSVTALTSKARDRGEHSSISIATPDTIQLIPRWLDKSSHDFFVELHKRIVAQSAPLHKRDAELDYAYDESGNPLSPSKWARYAHAPHQIKELLDEIDAKGGGDDTLLFALSRRKPLSRGVRWTRRYLAWFVILTLVGCAVGLAAQRLSSQQSNAIAFIIMGAVGLFFLGLTYITRNTPRSDSEWFVLHPFGVAMMGKVLTGELEWEGVKIINLNPSREAFEQSPTRVDHFRIETPDGAKITVPDVYDAPVCMIGQLTRDYFSRYRSRRYQATLEAEISR